MKDVKDFTTTDPVEEREDGVNIDLCKYDCDTMCCRISCEVHNCRGCPYLRKIVSEMIILIHRTKTKGNKPH